MLKRMINSSQIELDIIPTDPLLIKSGQATVSGVDMSFVRTYRFGEKEEPFIPGSSLKGMIRSYAEKICRSLRDPASVCLPYAEPGREGDGEEHQASCGLSFEKYKRENSIPALPSTEIYRNSCPACRLFGSHGFSGRFAVSDAYLKDDSKKNHLFEIRDGVAIDRITGGSAPGAKYELEVLTRGEFSTTLEIRNFERWQLGLVGLVLRDMEQGLVRVGFGKSRGLGRFNAKITRFRVAYYHQKESHLSGLSKRCTKQENRAYGFFPEPDNNEFPLPEPDFQKGISLHHEYTLTDIWKETLAPAVDDLVEFIKTTDWPQSLENFLKRGK
ncbi:MAG: CRISPR-associated RAMP protein [Desulfobacterales bacterium]|nr:CRISPR-associated RAMP protein [Desulfobacterales bacterium]